MNADLICEKNYQRLLDVIQGIDQPHVYPDGASAPEEDGMELQFSVLNRDRNGRASRIMLTRRGKNSEDDTSCHCVMEIQLYHSINLAAPFSCRDSNGYRCTQSERGHVLSVQMSDLNKVLEQWLRRLGRFGVRVCQPVGSRMRMGVSMQEGAGSLA